MARECCPFQDRDGKGIARPFEKLLEVGTVTRGCHRANTLFSSNVDGRPPEQ